MEQGPPPVRYILNVDAKVAHRSGALTERCNTDQVARRKTSLTLPESYRRCEHCFPPPSGNQGEVGPEGAVSLAVVKRPAN